MPTFTSSGTWTAPTTGTATITLDAGGGRGGDFDPVQETPGGGGGQGGAISVANLLVNQGDVFVVNIYSNQVIVYRQSNSGDMLMAMCGSQANGPWGGPGGYCANSGFAGQNIVNQTGNAGQNAHGSYGGQGGGSPGNGGSPSAAAVAGFPPRGGGGGQGLNGPGSGAAGGASRVTVTFSDGLPPA